MIAGQARRSDRSGDGARSRLRASPFGRHHRHRPLDLVRLPTLSPGCQAVHAGCHFRRRSASVRCRSSPALAADHPMVAFVPDLPVLAAYVVASVILGLTPGPDMTLFLSKTVAQSRAAGLAAFGGASTGLVVHSVLVAAGLSVLLAASVDGLHHPEDRRRALSRLSRHRRDPPRLVAVARQARRRASRSARSISRGCWSTCSIRRSSSSS